MSPLVVYPTKAAVDVPTPSIGFEPLEISSMYTPGRRYVGIRTLSLRSPPFMSTGGGRAVRCFSALTGASWGDTQGLEKARHGTLTGFRLIPRMTPSCAKRSGRYGFEI